MAWAAASVTLALAAPCLLAACAEPSSPPSRRDGGPASMLDGGTQRDASPAPRDAGPPAARFALALTGSGWQQPHTVLFDPSGALVVYGVTGGEMRVVGRTVAAARDPAWFLLKIAPDGELLWHATIDGAALDVADEIGWFPAMAVGPDGAIAVAAGLDEGEGEWPTRVVVYGPDGAVRWQRTYAGTDRPTTSAQVRTVDFLDDGRLVVAGWVLRGATIGGQTLEDWDDFVVPCSMADDGFVAVMSPGVRPEGATSPRCARADSA